MSPFAVRAYACAAVLFGALRMRIEPATLYGGMNDHFLVTCPYCGEEVEIYLEPDVDGTLVQDCEICCNPWRLRISSDEGGRWLDVQRADGSE
jgi:hypothetical protein